jgi:hypothetical protein
MAAKILVLFALLALSVSAATALSFPQYNPSSTAFEVNNPYCQYNLPLQDFAASIPQSLALAAQQQYCPCQIAQLQILQQALQQQVQQQVQQQQILQQAQQ